MQAKPTYQSRSTTARTLGAISFAALITASAGCAAQTQTQPETPVVPPPPPVTTGIVPPAPPPPPFEMGTMPPGPPVSPVAAGTAPQRPAPGVAAAVPPPTAPLPPPGAVPAPLADTGAAVTAQGTVTRFLTNPDGDVDGLLMGDGRVVRVPPHLGPQLTAMVRPGDVVQFDGLRDAGGNVTAQRITDTRSGQQLVDQPPMPGTQPMPPALRGAAWSRLSAQGQVLRVTTAPRGEPDGVILADGTVIKLTPPIAQQFPALVHVGAKVSAQGYGTRNQFGTALQATAFGSPGNLTRLYDRAPPTP